MSNFLRKGNRISKVKVSKISTNGEITVEWVNLKDLHSSPSFYKRTEEEKRLKKLSIYNGKTPIECLEINGYKVLKDTVGNVIVGVDKSHNIFEGMDEPRSWEDEFLTEKLQSIPMEKISDYNSLWEITKSGWDSEKELVYPYIFILNPETKEMEAWRWDNSHFLRVNCLTHNWDNKNYRKFYKSNEFKMNFK